MVRGGRVALKQEADHAEWFRGQDNCVEAAFVPGFAGVRDTKDRSYGTLVFDTATWASFVAAVKSGHRNI